MEFAYAMGLKEPEKKQKKMKPAMEFATAMGLKNPLSMILDLFDEDTNDHMRPRFAV